MDSFINKFPLKNNNSAEVQNCPQMDKETKRKNKFVEGWLKDPELKDWLTKKKYGENEFAFCKICNQRIVPHKGLILRHKETNKHITAAKTVAATVPLPNCLTSSLTKRIQRAEIKIAGLLATENLSFLLVDTLMPVLKSAITDSQIIEGIKLHRTKATGIVKHTLGEVFSKKLNSKISKGYYSIIMDETTDVGCVGQCAIAAIFYDDERKQISNCFFDMVECKQGTAQSLFDKLKESIESKGIPFQNMVAWSADTPNVMFGEKNSVSTRLQKENPNMVLIKCSCHVIHLVASKSCLHMPVAVEDLLRNVGAHFNRSYIRYEKLKEFQEYFNTEVHKMLTPCRTRWLSIISCVERVIEQYDVLCYYMRLQVFEDPSKTTSSMLESLDDPATIIYLHFMQYSLSLLTDFNLLFQSDRPLLYKVQPSVEKLLQTIMSNFIIITFLKGFDLWKIDHDDEKTYLDIQKVYIGVKAHELLKKQEIHVQLEILKKCRSFYIESVTQIKKRFNFSDPIYEVLRILDPYFAQSYELQSLATFKERFPYVAVSLQDLDNEWRSHALLDYRKLQLDPSSDVEIYWQKVFDLKNNVGNLLFPNLKKALSLLLILPFSNASVERVFSSVKIIKNDKRNRLNTDTLRAILHVKQGIKINGYEQFDPTAEMLNKSWADF